MPGFQASSPVRAGPILNRRPRLDVILAAPRGFCAGVRRAIDAVVAALDRHGAPVYVRRAIVHNLAVVRSLEAQGAIFVQGLDEVPEGAVVVLSAHGVPPDVVADARQRRLISYDAICPLVAKVHREVSRHHETGRHVILIGHEGHPEIIGTMGQVPIGAVTLVTTARDASGLDLPRDMPLAYAVQTTYSVEEAQSVVDALKTRFPDVQGPSSSDICYATTNRQAAVRMIAPQVDAMIIVGEGFSSNACRLAEVAASAGCANVHLVADADAIDWEALPPQGSIGISAAASTPEISVNEILDALRSRYRLSIGSWKGADETITFRPVRIG